MKTPRRRINFGERAAQWDAMYSGRAPRDLSLKNLMARQRFMLEMVEATLPRGSKILDAGCGPGEMAAKLMDRGYEVWGVDVAEAMIAFARERCRTNHFRVGDIEHIPFADQTFDGVICLGVLEYLDRDEGALREFRRVLKPGGRAFISTPSGMSPLYRADRLLYLVKEGATELSDRLRKQHRSAQPRLMPRRYFRRSWFRRMRSEGLHPEQWACFGWGWYTTRFGSLIELMSRSSEYLHRGAERLFGAEFVRRAQGVLARNLLVNWLCCEQLVQLRADDRPSSCSVESTAVA